MDSFKADFELSKKTEYLRNDIYRQYLSAINISRYTKEDKFILDIEYHIDCVIKTSMRTKLTLQEKGLRHKFAKYNTFTIEYMQDSESGGEFFNLCSQLYFHGYLNQAEDQFDKWIILDVAKFFIWIAENRNLIKVRKDKNSRASFLHIDYGFLPKEVLIAENYYSNREPRCESLSLANTQQ